jgi:spermidine synthase
MAKSRTSLVNDGDERGRWPLLLAALFFGSGCAALIYEIVWFQLLELVIGSTAVSIGVLLATFMGGMCAGSLAFPRMISARWNALRVYGLLEGGIGMLGIAVQMGMPYLNDVYVAHAAGGSAGIFLRGILAGACLLPPTFLMGAALPVISRQLGTSRRDAAWLGFLYGCNTVGGVMGAALAGFYLLRAHDMTTAAFCAVGINFLVALIASGISGLARSEEIQSERKLMAGQKASSKAFWVIGLSGVSALGAEVVWTRLLSLALGPSVYTFSVILVVLLAGLGIGSAAASAVVRRVGKPLSWLGVCQWLLAAAIAWAAILITQWVPMWRIDPSMSAWQRIWEVDLLRCAIAIGPATLLWGASFPLALAAAMEGGGDAARVTGSLYAANTLGAIVGATGFSLLLVPAIGTRQSQAVMVAVCVIAAAVAMFRRGATGWRAAVFVGGLVVAAVFSRLIPAVPWEMVAYGRQTNMTPTGNWPLFVGEGINSSIAVTTDTAGDIKFHVAGKVEASSGLNDMRLQRMLGLLPGLVHPDLKSVLVVGCGAGVTAGSFVVQPAVRRIVICEIEPLVPQIAAKFFFKQNFDVVNDPRVQIVYDDARHFVRTTGEQFDVITSDPINPWVRGAATLYTREYFEMCREHLKPGGLISQWVPLYETSKEAVKSELATFFAVFPHGTIWINRGSDLVMFAGRDEGMTIDADAIEANLNLPENQRVLEAMREMQWPAATDLFGHYAGRAEDLRGWLSDAQINTDANLRLGYLAALGRDSGMQSQLVIDHDILGFYRYPEELFKTRAATRAALEMAIEREGKLDMP